jgi:hypothetical protein
MTPVSQGWTGYLTHLQEHHRYPAVKNLAKMRNDPPAKREVVLTVSSQILTLETNLSGLTRLNSQ